MSIWIDDEGQERSTYASDEAHELHDELDSDGRDAVETMRPTT